MTRFFKRVNGGFSEGKGDLICYVDAMPSDDEHNKIVSEVADDAAEIMFTECLPAPSASKWTKSSPCTDRLLFGFICFLFPGVVKLATGKLEFTVTEGDADFGEIDATIEWRSSVERDCVLYVCLVAWYLFTIRFPMSRKSK